MSSLVLALAVLTQAKASALDGVWSDVDGHAVVIRGGTVEWERMGQYVSATVHPVEDGSFFGEYIAGRELKPSYYDLGRDTYRSVAVDSGKAFPIVGEARLSVTKLGASGNPAVLVLATGGKSQGAIALTKTAHLDILSVDGRFGDKDLKIEVRDQGGPDAKIEGTVEYLGSKLTLRGRRRLARAYFDAVDTSRDRNVVWGYIVWAPSADRVSSIADRNATATDGVNVYLKLNDGTTGIHKTLKRVP